MSKYIMQKQEDQEPTNTISSKFRKLLYTFKKQSPYSRQASRQILLQYGLSLIIYPAILIILFLLGTNGYYTYRKMTRDESSLIFWFARVVAETLPVWVALFGIGGWVVLTYYFVCKPLRYVDELIEAAEALAASGEAPIRLSPALGSVQDNLNLVREQALRSAILAKEAEQRKNDLVVYLAHDLKTPLTSVIGYLTLLRDEPQISPELRARYTGIALEKAERLENLINEFFDITRFSLTSLSLELERISLSRMLEQIVSEFIPILNEKELTWKTEITPGIDLCCDPDKLQRVFDNLVRNAVNYSYSGTELSLSLKESEAGVEIQVQNHGKTIPPDKLGRIFEQFFRLDSARTSSTGGAGLGLAIAKEIVELHGGAITAASENESITFTVQLPLQPPTLSAVRKS